MKNKNFPVVIFSTLFAAMLWASVNLGYEYQTVVSVPLVLENMKFNRALARPLPRTVNVKIRASGWQIMRLYFIPDARYMLDVGEISVKYNFAANKDLPERLKLPLEIGAIEVMPETIAVVLDEKVRKTVPVAPVVRMNFREGYGLVGEIRTTPDSITLTGARSVLEKIDQWQTSPLVFSNLKSDVTAPVTVSDTLAYAVTPSPSSVSLEMSVQPTAEKSFKGISVEVNQVPVNRLVVLIPPKIDIIVRGGIEQIAGIEQKDFSAYIDYKSILLDTSGAIQPTLTMPKNIKIVRQEPEHLQYVVRK